MRLLLDTHIWLWLQTEPERISPGVLAAINDAGNEVALSAISSLEIATKYAAGRLPLPQPPAQYVPARMVATGVSGLPVEHAHTLRVSLLPFHHRDPFDRILVAQAQVETMRIVTADKQLRAYDVDIQWATE